MSVINYQAGLTATEKDTYRLLPSAFSKVTLSAVMSGSVNSSYTLTVRRNGSDTTASCTVNNTTLQTSTAVTPFSAGDRISIKLVGTTTFGANTPQPESLSLYVSFQ